MTLRLLGDVHAPEEGLDVRGGDEVLEFVEPVLEPLVSLAVAERRTPASQNLSSFRNTPLRSESCFRNNESSSPASRKTPSQKLHWSTLMPSRSH